MKKFFKALGIILLCGLAVLGGYTVGNYFINGKAPAIFAKEIPKTNIMVMGLDKEGLRSDVMMIFMIDPKDKSINVISIPRDSRVKYKNEYRKLNSVIGIGGEKETLKVVSEITGEKIDYYATLTFEGFRKIIDILGGVDFDVPERMYYVDPTQNLNINLKKGMQHLNGDKAEQLVRYRQYKLGDEKRISVQQEFLKELVRQKANASLILKAPSLISQIVKNVKTNIPASLISSYVGGVGELINFEINTHQLPGEAKYIGDVSYYIYNQKETKSMFNQFKLPKPTADAASG